MVESNKPAELVDLWNGSSPRVMGNWCLNVRHGARACRLCVDACPVGAISIPRGDSANAAPVALDQGTCVRCGLCLHVCPTGVFVQTNSPESKLAQAITNSLSSTIELACPRKEPVDLSQAPEASVVQTARCLAALSAPALLEMAATGKTLWLNDRICHTCPIGQARWAIQRTIATANRWLQVVGYQAIIRSYLINAEDLTEAPVSRPVIQGSQPIMSRRDFFRSVTRLAEQATGLAEESPPTGDGMGRRLPHHIPAQRQHLAAALGQLSPHPSASVPTAALPIADVTISDDCTACGLCAQFCPTEAVSFVSDNEYYVLNFSAALCLGDDCNLCVIGCPTHAVAFGQEVMAGELLRTRPRPVKAGRLASCAQCGALTAADKVGATDEAPLCYVCQAQANCAHHRPGPAGRYPH